MSIQSDAYRPNWITTMRLKALHHVRFGVTDLDRTASFAVDFGLIVAGQSGGRLYMRTAGGDAYSYVAESGGRSFRAIGFLAEGMADLEEAVALHGASPIQPLDGPGGGYGVTLIDPEGLTVEIVTGLDDDAPVEGPMLLRHNAPGAISRFTQAQEGRDLRPAHLYRLGHVGLYVTDYAACAAWYREKLGMLVSDTIHNGNPEEKIVGFLRLDRGDEWVDHHSLFLIQFGKRDCHHISFEVADYEAQFMAHRYLQDRGWTPNWGVGRHPLGSHVFDVWFDPDKYRFETFSDTDVVTAGRQAANHDIHEAKMDLWSSESPERYFN